MRETVAIAFVSIWGFLVGVLISYDVESQKMMQRCIEANPTIASGDIKKYCEERLYLKESE